MTEAQFAELLGIAKQCRFLLQVLAISSTVGLGFMLWRLIVLGKNQSSFW